MMRTTPPASLLRLSRLAPVGAFLCLLAGPALAQVSITSLGTPVTENFDTLANTGTSSALPTGWAFVETGTNANGTYTAGTGSSGTGDTYSFGAASNSERALGGLQSSSLVPTFGASFANNTGGTITSLDIAYTGEQWRLGTLSRVDRIDFQYSLDATSLSTGTWTDVNTLDFTAPVTGPSTGALDGNASANRTALTASITGLSIAPGATFWIRWTDFGATGADDGLAADDFSLTAQGTGGGIVLSINNVTVTEGNSGTALASFTVSLSAPAPVGGVTFDIATADGTATVGDSDYASNALTGQTIAAGNSSYTFDVTVNGDGTTEPDETFLVNVTNVTGTGVVVGDGQGQGTITNDDFTYTAVHDIQGSGLTSTMVGTGVTIRGIVTGVKYSGFFVQAADPDADLDPNTSEAILVYTGSAPPPAAAVGNEVRVTGTVAEFIPPSDPASQPTTELSGAITVTSLSTGNPLPTPVILTTADTSPTGTLWQLERLEGMRVTVPSLTVGAPTGKASSSEPNATSTSNGVFYGVITGLPRPFREAGIAASDPLPPSPPCCIPRFDENPERLRVDSDGQVGATALEVTAGAVVTGITSPLDYAYRTYTLVPDPATPPAVSGIVTAGAVPVPAAGEATVASWNLERFFNTVDDPPTGGEPVLTPTAFANRLNKASLAIRNVLRSPDILGVVEMENLSTLQALATKVNADTVIATGSDPVYQAYLQEGNDPGGIDVGFLVKSTRVGVAAVTQFGLTATYINPTTGLPETLWDRPPLVLEATVNPVGGNPFPVTVIANHLRSLSGIDDPTDGPRVRAKRRAEAEYLADLIQDRQLANPGERILAVGDFNAFQVNDGYVDLIGTIKGTPTHPDNVVLASSDLVSPDLLGLTDGPSAEQYSFSFDGNAQQLDHILMTANATSQLTGFHFARVSSDFPESYRNDPLRPERLSDHDAPVAYLRGLSADLGVAIADAPDPGYGGTPITYTATASNLGPDPATNVTVTLTLAAGLGYGGGGGTGWSCSESGGVVTCSASGLAMGTAPDITILATTPVTGGSFLSTVSVASATSDPAAPNNSASASTLVASDVIFKDGFQ
ncbi:MAG TPA: endonuclease/exonuclease/phosphatase family protein [Vicinamibacteria bacterium]|nr:endonuclease/exonuclease/phosphatase family protein [Vicinamibacteria bacterium]